MRTTAIILTAAILLALSSITHAAMIMPSPGHNASILPDDGAADQQSDAETLAKKKKKKKKKKSSAS